MAKTPEEPESRGTGSRGQAAETFRRAVRLLHSDRDQAVALARQALELAKSEGDLLVQSQAYGLLADADRLAGRMESAFEFAQHAVHCAKAAGNTEAEADAVNNLGAQAWNKGEFDLAMHWFQEALRLREELGRPGDIAATCNNLGVVCCEKGDLATALSYLQRSLEIRERTGDKYVSETYLNLGVLYVDLGDWDKALESYFRVLTELERAEHKEHMALCYNNIAELYLRRGKLDRARFHLDQALELADAARIPFARAAVLGTMGEVAAAAGDHARAQDYYEQCSQVCLECGNRDELVQTLRRWAELEIAAGDRDQARRRLADAEALCAQVGACKEAGNVQRVKGELLAREGAADPARASLELSIDSFRSLGSSYELGCSLLALGRLLDEVGDDGQPVLTEAQQIFRELGVGPKLAEVGNLLRGPVETKEGVGLVQELAELACARGELDAFCEGALELLCRRLPVSGAAILLRDGKMYRRGEDTDTREDGGETRLGLDVGGARLGTLVLRGEVEPLRVRPLTTPLALGVAAVRPGGAAPALEAGEAKRFPDIIGIDTTLRPVMETIERVASTTASVLLLGESGTGKEVFARKLHDLSDRRDKPFVAVNCAAIPDTLLESELFGIEKGTATGVAAREGKFEVADGGTVFLDEIGDMNLALQAKMLRVLESRVVERVGGRKPVEVDVRVVAATNQDLEHAIATGDFRQDLYYRLNVIAVSLPPLRDRQQDIPAFVEYFVQRYAREYAKPVRGVTDDCLNCLMNYGWGGNVRELKNVVERGVLIARGERVTAQDLPPDLQVAQGSGPSWSEVRSKAKSSGVAPVEQGAIVAALEQCDWVVQRAAERLGMSRTHLYRMMRKHGIRRPKPTGG